MHKQIPLAATAMRRTQGQRLREAIQSRDIFPLIGVYDTFSASIAARHFDGIFLSGFGFAASYYGLPDIGLIAWPDMVALLGRIRCILPEHHLMVDIDDGYCDVEVACHVVSVLESAGASGVILEDQKRPRRCGHFGGKQLLELDEYLAKLERVLETRRDMVVVARTDASDEAEIARRVAAFAAAGADAILVDGLVDLSLLPRLKRLVGLPLVFNQIAGGKSPRVDLQELKSLGVSLVVYSTPCLFAAQAAMDDAMRSLIQSGGMLDDTSQRGVNVSRCTDVLQENLRRRDEQVPRRKRAKAA